MEIIWDSHVWGLLLVILHIRNMYMLININWLMLVIMFGQIPDCWTWNLLLLPLAKFPNVEFGNILIFGPRSRSSRSISCLNWSLEILTGFFFPQWGKVSKQGEQKLWIQKFCCCCYRLRLWHEHGFFARDDRWCDQKHLLKKWDFVQIILAQASCKSSAVACQWWWLAWLQSPLLEPLRACLPHPTPLPPPAHDVPQKQSCLLQCTICGKNTPHKSTCCKRRLMPNFQASVSLSIPTTSMAFSH